MTVNVLLIMFLLSSLQLANRQKYLAEERPRVRQNNYCSGMHMKSHTVFTV